MKKVIKPTKLQTLQADYEEFRNKARAALHTLRYPTVRNVAKVEAATAEGKLNGLTVVELLTMVNMAKSTGERVVLDASYDKKTIVINLEKIPSTSASLLL